MKTKVSKFLALILAALMFISMVPAAGMRNVNAAPKNPDLLKSTPVVEDDENVVPSYYPADRRIEIAWERMSASANYFKVYIESYNGSGWESISGAQKFVEYNIQCSMAIDLSAGIYRIRVEEYPSSASSTMLAKHYSKAFDVEAKAPTVAPENFTVKANTNGKYDFTWNNPAALTNAQKYVIECSKDNVNWAELESYGADNTTSTVDVAKNAALLNTTLDAVNYFRICYISSDGIKGPYSEVKDCKYDNVTLRKEELTKKCEESKKTPATITYAGGFDVKKPVAAGMKKTYDHPAYNLSIECVSINNSLGFKYTLTTKMDAEYCMDRDLSTNYYSDKDEWKAADGTKVPITSKYGELKAGGVYTLITSEPYSGSSVGHNATTLQVDIRNNSIYYDASFKCAFDYSKAPGVGTVNTVKVTTNSLQFVPSILMDGSYTVSYKKKSDKKWKTINLSNNGTTVKKLKASSTYQYKWSTTVKCSYTDDSGASVSYTLSSPESKVKNVKTGLKTKPSVKSISTSGANHSKKWVKSQWLGNKLVHRGYWSDTTTFNLNVKLNKKVKGAKGYLVEVNGAAPIYVKGNKTSFTVKTSVKNNQIGKAVKVKVSTYSNADKTGFGKYSKTFKAIIKK